MTNNGLRFLEALAAQKGDGCYVEIGPLFGSSTNAIAAGRKTKDRIHTIDTFEPAPWVRKRFGFDLSRERFDQFTSGISDLVVHEGFSPDIVRTTWSETIGFYFDDATHGDPGWSNNFEFFSRYFAENAIICGDDFAGGWPDVVRNVRAIAGNWDAKVYVIGRVWAMTKRDEERILNAVKHCEPSVSDISITARHGDDVSTLPAGCWSVGLHGNKPLSSFSLSSDRPIEGQIVTWRDGMLEASVNHGEGSVELVAVDKIYAVLPKGVALQFCTVDAGGRTENSRSIKSGQWFNLAPGSSIVAVRLCQI
jgi:hypothetical protein